MFTEYNMDKIKYAGAKSLKKKMIIKTLASTHGQVNIMGTWLISMDKMKRHQNN